MKPVPKSLEVLVSTSEQKISVTQTRQDGPDRNDAAEGGVARDLLMVERGSLDSVIVGKGRANTLDGRYGNAPRGACLPPFSEKKDSVTLG